MKLAQFPIKYVVLMLLMSVLVFSCKKEDEGDPYPSNEAINLLSPDTTVLFAQAGSVFDFSVYIVIDKPVDTIRVGYAVDTLMSTNIMPFNMVDTVVLVSGFAEVNNKQLFSGSFQLPDSVINVRAFRPYQPAQPTPVFIPAVYDAVRVVLKVEATGNRNYEKYLKVIIE
jgi:hypothetical protein